jgi:hypothetical protein
MKSQIEIKYIKNSISYLFIGDEISFEKIEKHKWLEFNIATFGSNLKNNIII